MRAATAVNEPDLGPKASEEDTSSITEMTVTRMSSLMRGGKRMACRIAQLRAKHGCRTAKYRRYRRSR